MTALTLVLIGVVAFAYHLNLRLRRLEERFESEMDRAYGFAPTWQESAVAEPVAEEAPVPAVLVGKPREPAVVSYYQPPQPPEPPTDNSYEAEVEHRRWNLSISFEDLFGRRLPIWAGGITLAVAGMLIVKLSIDSGLLSPPIRVILGLIFGTLLIAGAELALRFEEKIRDPRVRQALAGAGVASLYASILIAVNLYHLIAPLGAMFGMAGVTALAMFLSLRFGAPSALLGLAGGLAAPALVGSTEPSVPLLSVYLALAVSGLCTLSRSQRWAWLGISALVGGFGWGIVLLLGGVLDTASSISLGLYLLLLGVGIPALGFAGSRKNQLQLVAGIVSAAQMAALVATGGFELVNWALFGMLAIASIWLAERDGLLARLPAVGMVVALLLMGAWTSPTERDFALVMSGCVLIYGAPAVWKVWRSGGLLEAAEIGVLGLSALLIPMYHFHQADGPNDHIFGLLALALSVGVAVCAALGWEHTERRNDARFVLLTIVTATLLAGAALLLLQIWAAGIAIALIGFVLLHLGQLADDDRFEAFAWTFATVGLFAYPYSMIADGADFSDTIDAAGWTAQAGIAAMFAWRARIDAARAVAQFIAPALLCLALTFVLPDRVQSLIAPVLIVAAALASRLIDQRLVPAMASCVLMIVGWALVPMFDWSTAGTSSLTGAPFLVNDVPKASDALTHLLIPGAAVAGAFVIAALLRWLDRVVGWSIAGVLATIGVHSLYKHAFAIGSFDVFVRLGLMERTVWEMALAAIALVAIRLRRPIPGLVFAAAAAMHEAYYTLVLHNPLWSNQVVGAWPALNLLLPVYALAIGLTLLGKRAAEPIAREVSRGLDFVLMGLIVLFSFSELRQLFHGSLLVGQNLPVAEDILRSILAIALAIGFLLWGIARKQRDWRLASLALMLAAVGKVFLMDASGLEGVTRILSFVALGFSLIGIGWLYSRHLGSDKSAVSAA